MPASAMSRSRCTVAMGLSRRTTSRQPRPTFWCCTDKGDKITFMTYIASQGRPRLLPSRMTLAVALLAIQTGLAQAESGDTSAVRLLKEELARRDAAIIDLQNRVKALE